MFGGAAVYIGTGDEAPNAPLEVERVGKGGLKYLTVMTRRQLKAGDIERNPSFEWVWPPKNYTLDTVAGEHIVIYPSRLVLLFGAMAPNEHLNTALNQGWGKSF